MVNDILGGQGAGAKPAVSDTLDDNNGEQHTWWASCGGEAISKRMQFQCYKLTRMLTRSRRPSARTR
eukprot:9401538-Alexandrium_andersonii.AAC.1